MVEPKPLSEQDLATVRAELSTGKPSTVWFTPASVAVPTGGSAKVVSLRDASEGEFIQVRPAGSRDTMFCSPSELTRTRPPRKRKPQPPQAAPQPPVVPTTEPTPAASAAQRPPAQSPPRTPIVEKSTPAAPAAGKSTDRRRASGAHATARPSEVTVTLTGSAEGEWTVEVMIGRKRAVRPTPVQPADIAQAARSLPAAVTEAIEASLDAARQRQLERVEQLRVELEAAQRALEELSG
jgi:uncharacterized protein DUF6319